MKEEKKEYSKYGLLFAISWNVLMFIILAVSNFVQGNNLFYMESVHWYDMPTIVMICTLVWYWIGYSLRKQFIEQKKYYQHKYESLNHEKASRLFKIYYFSRYSKIMTLVCFTAIPWYIIGYVKENFTPIDFVVIGSLFLLALILLLTTIQLKKIIKSIDL